MTRFRVLLTFCCLLVLAGCRHKVEDGPVTPVIEDQTEASLKKQLADAYGIFLESLYAGNWYTEIVYGTQDYTVRFSGNKSVTLKTSVLGCTDLEESPLPSMHLNDNGIWIVNSRNTGMAFSNALRFDDLKPLWLSHNRTSLSIHLNNGKKMTFVKGKEFLMDSFQIIPENNPGLSARPEKLVEDTRISFLITDKVSSLVLTPSFDITCKSIKVNGVEQVSESTAQDFSKDVRYDIEMFDGNIHHFTVHAIRKALLPVVRIKTEGNAPILDKEHYVHGSVLFLDKSNLYSTVDSAFFEMKENGIRGRGNSTWGMPKKPYRIKLDSKSEVFGIAKDKDWVLLANYADKSLLRNMLAMKLSEIMGFPWTPKMYPVQVFLNGDYLGLYTFSEHKKVSKSRVDIDVDAGDVYLEVEQAMDEPVCFHTSSFRVPVMFQDPGQPDAQLLSETKAFFKDLEDALESDSPSDPSAGWPAYIDEKTLIDNYIIQELAKNIDGNLRKSTFFTRKKGGKLVFYHIWDMDIAFGNADYFTSEFSGNGIIPSATNGPEGWFIKDYGRTDYGNGKSWYKTLMKNDPQFVQKVKSRWNELKPQFEQIPQWIDEQYAFLYDGAGKNFDRWKILDIYVWPNVKVTGSYKGEVLYLREFYNARLQWLDENINSL